MIRTLTFKLSELPLFFPFVCGIRKCRLPWPPPKDLGAGYWQSHQATR